MFNKQSIHCNIVTIYHNTIRCCIHIPAYIVSVVSSPNPEIVSNYIITVNGNAILNFALVICASYSKVHITKANRVVAMGNFCFFISNFKQCF